MNKDTQELIIIFSIGIGFLTILLLSVFFTNRKFNKDSKILKEHLKKIAVHNKLKAFLELHSNALAIQTLRSLFPEYDIVLVNENTVTINSVTLNLTSSGITISSPSLSNSKHIQVMSELRPAILKILENKNEV